LRKPSVNFARSAVRPDQFPADGLPEIAFLGRSNVGKSSLINALAGTRRLARVSATPGRTRTVNFFRWNDELYLADLPGYGYARVPDAVRREWEPMAVAYLAGRATLALGILVVDARREPGEADAMLERFLSQQRIEYVVAATKLDALRRGQQQTKLSALDRRFAPREVFPVSAETGFGIDALRRRVLESARATARPEVTA